MGNKLASSSTGVLIAMKRFNEIIYDPSGSTVQIGAGYAMRLVIVPI